MLKVTNQNYCGTVVKLPPKQPVQGLDNLVKVTVFGNDVLISKDDPEDELYVFFPCESQLSQAFLSANSLFREVQWNVNSAQKGFFEQSGRVKAIKFKGVISTGFLIPVSSLHYLNSRYIPKAGDEFNEIEEKEVVIKYIIRHIHENGPKGDKQNKMNVKMTQLLVPHQFRFHSETNQLARSLHMFKEEDIIILTDKWHGSSCILSNVLIRKKLNWRQKLLNLLGGKVDDKEYGYIYSSGKPKSNLPKGIEGAWINNGTSFYISDIWKRAFDDYKHALEPGITLYGELVGYTKDGAFIQKGYDYGCKVGEYKFMVYRITYTKPDGNLIEFSWQQIKGYCAKFELQHVVELNFCRIEELMANGGIGEEFPFEVKRDMLLSRLQSTLERTCPYCTTGVPSEGVVLRRDGHHFYDAYKVKSKMFLKRETDELDKGIVSIEEEANNA